MIFKILIRSQKSSALVRPLLLFMLNVKPRDPILKKNLLYLSNDSQIWKRKRGAVKDKKKNAGTLFFLDLKKERMALLFYIDSYFS